MLLVVISVTTSLGIHPASAQQVSPTGCPVGFVCTQYTPKINISQSSVSVGDRLELYGSNFAPINAVLFDGVSSGRIASEDGSSVSVIIPASLKAGSHTLAIQNVYGTSTAASFSVVASKSTKPLPTINLAVSTSTVFIGGSATLVWSTTNATYCTGSGDWPNTALSNPNVYSQSTYQIAKTYGTTTLSKLTSDATIILSCTGPGGSVATTSYIKVNSFVNITSQTKVETWQKATSTIYHVIINTDLSVSLTDLIPQAISSQPGTSGRTTAYRIFLSNQAGSSSNSIATSDIPIGSMLPSIYNSGDIASIIKFNEDGSETLDNKVSSDAFTYIPLGTYTIKVATISCPGSFIINDTVISTTTKLTSSLCSSGHVKNTSGQADKKFNVFSVNPVMSVSTSSSTVTITAAPDPFVLITNPIAGDQWMSGTSHKVTWVTNFIKGRSNTGLSKWDGLRIRSIYGVGVNPYDHGSNPLGSLAATVSTEVATNVASMLTSSIAISLLGYSIPIVGPIIGGIIDILDWTGVFDTAPSGINTTISLVPYNPTTGVSGTPIKLSSPLIEQSKAGVTINKNIPLGTYEIELVAKINKTTSITATSGVFSVVSFVKPLIDSVWTQATTTASTSGTFLLLNGNGYASSSNTLTIKPVTGSGKPLVIKDLTSIDGMHITTILSPGLVASSSMYTFVVSNWFGTSTALKAAVTFVQSASTPLTGSIVSQTVATTTSNQSNIQSSTSSQATSTPPQNVATSSSATSTSTNTVITPAPTITFTASPASVTKRGSTTLTWVVTNATKCLASIAGNGPMAQSWKGYKNIAGGTEKISNIMFNSTYVLTCTGSGGSTSASTIVTISPTAFFDIYSMTADAWDGLKSLFGF